MGKDDKQDQKIEALGYPLRMLAQARLFITSRLLAAQNWCFKENQYGTWLRTPGPVQA